MKLVSAAKLRKAQEAVTRSRYYTDALNTLLAEIVQEAGGADFSHPLMEAHSEVKNIGVLVIGGGRGLCGGYNTNLNKRVDAFVKEKAAAGNNVQVVSYILGKKPAEHYRRVKRSYEKSFEKLSEDANTWPVDEVCRELEQMFLDRKIDELYVVFTKFKSALSMTPTVDKLLPMDPSTLPAVTAKEGQGGGTTIFEPSAREVFSALIPRIMRSKVRQASLDAKASEQGSRMTAMENATKNATELIYNLDLKYNKLRQSRITAELLDIIGGAEAL
jgi:F-type H+-transporting ATPase subunit gamma